MAIMPSQMESTVGIVCAERERFKQIPDKILVFWGTFFPGLDGFEEIKNPELSIFRTYLPDIAAFVESNHKPGESVVCTGKIKHVGSTYIDQWEYLKSKVPAEEVKHCKLTLAAPNWYHLRYREGVAYPKSVYANDEEYFADIAKAYQDELQILYDHGVRNIQFDDPNFACKFLFSFSCKSVSDFLQTFAPSRCWTAGKRTPKTQRPRSKC